MAEEEFKTTSVRLRKKQVEDIDELAASLGRSRGWLIEQACALYLEREQRLPQVDWTTSDESGSCGRSYRMDVHFSLPSVVGGDGAAFLLREDIIGRIAAAGAREVWTELQAVGALMNEEDAVAEYRNRDSEDEDPRNFVGNPNMSLQVDTGHSHGLWLTTTSSSARTWSSPMNGVLTCACPECVNAQSMVTYTNSTPATVQFYPATVDPSDVEAVRKEIALRNTEARKGKERPSQRWVWNGDIWQPPPCECEGACACSPAYPPCFKGCDPNTNISCEFCPWGGF